MEAIGGGMVTWGMTTMGSPFRLRLLDLRSIGSSSTGAGELNLASSTGGLGIA